MNIPERVLLLLIFLHHCDEWTGPLIGCDMNDVNVLSASVKDWPQVSHCFWPPLWSVLIFILKNHISHIGWSRWSCCYLSSNRWSDFGNHADPDIFSHDWKKHKTQIHQKSNGLVWISRFFWIWFSYCSTVTLTGTETKDNKHSVDRQRGLVWKSNISLKWKKAAEFESSDV